MKKFILLFCLLFPILCFAQESYFASYHLYASWNEANKKYDKGAALSTNKNPLNIPSLRLAADGLYMPADKLACAKPKYETNIVPSDKIPAQFSPIFDEPVTAATAIRVTSDACGMALLYVNNKFIMVFAHDGLPLVYVKNR